MRTKLLVRLALFLAVLVVIALVFIFGRRLGLSEIVVVGAIVGLVLLANGLTYVIGQAIRGYRGQG